MLFCSKSTRYYVTNPQLQMQAAHPRFHFHEGNWLIRHLAISHLTNMNRKFRKMEPDPNIILYCRYLARKDARGRMPGGSHKVRMYFTVYVLSLLLQKTPTITNNPAPVPPRATPRSVDLPMVSLTFYIVLILVTYTHPSRNQKRRLTLSYQYALLILFLLL